MSAGRQPTVKAPTINAPAPITQADYTTPTGDTYGTWRIGNTQDSQSFLSPQTAGTIQTSQDALQNLAQNLAQPSDQMVQNINQQSQDFYNLQAQNINNESNNEYDQTESDLAKRFGGAYNATFGATTLGQIQKNRLNALATAGEQATLYGQDLYNQDQANQINRFQLFNNYLNNQNNQANTANALDSNLLENEANRGQSLGIAQAQLQQQANLANLNTAMQIRQQKIQAAQNAMNSAGTI